MRYLHRARRDYLYHDRGGLITIKPHLYPQPQLSYPTVKRHRHGRSVCLWSVVSISETDEFCGHHEFW